MRRTKSRLHFGAALDTQKCGLGEGWRARTCWRRSLRHVRSLHCRIIGFSKFVFFAALAFAARFFLKIALPAAVAAVSSPSISAPAAATSAGASTAAAGAGASTAGASKIAERWRLNG